MVTNYGSNFDHQSQGLEEKNYHTRGKIMTDVNKSVWKPEPTLYSARFPGCYYSSLERLGLLATTTDASLKTLIC